MLTLIIWFYKSIACSAGLFQNARLARVQHGFVMLWADCISKVVFVFCFVGIKDGALDGVDTAFSDAIFSVFGLFLLMIKHGRGCDSVRVEHKTRVETQRVILRNNVNRLEPKRRGVMLILCPSCQL